MSRTTKWLAILFFITSGTLAYLSRGTQGPAPSIMDAVPAIEQSAPEETGQDLPPVEDPEADEATDAAQDVTPPVEGSEGGE